MSHPSGTGRQSLASGDFAPFRGFAGVTDYRNALATSRPDTLVAAGMPPLLLVDEEEASELKIPDDIILRDLNGKNIALMHIEEKFKTDVVAPAKLFGNADDRNIVVAGPIEIVRVETGSDAEVIAGGMPSGCAEEAAETGRRKIL